MCSVYFLILEKNSRYKAAKEPYNREYNCNYDKAACRMNSDTAVFPWIGKLPV